MWFNVWCSRVVLYTDDICFDDIKDNVFVVSFFQWDYLLHTKTENPSSPLVYYIHVY